MSFDSVPVAIAAVSGLATMALFAAGAIAISLAMWLRKGGGAGPVAVLQRSLGVVVLCLLPLGFVSIFGFVAAVVVEAAYTPAIAFPFVSIAGLAGIRAARDSGGGEMRGCTQLITTFLACYVVVWGAVAWWMAGGNESLAVDVRSLRWIQPPLAALPFALIIWRISGKKRTSWLLFGAIAFLSAYFALWFFTIENGFGAELLPSSDWLRFPLAGMLLWLPFSIVPFLSALNAPAQRRRRQLRDTWRNSLPIILLGAPMGLTWAGARALAALA